MKAILLSITFVLVPLVSWANTAVYTSDHALFTRIIVDVDNGADWIIDQSGDKYIVKLNGPDAFYKTKALNHIDKSRITNLHAEGDTLSFTLTCNCDVTPTPIGSQKLLLDVIPRTTSRHTEQPPLYEPVATTQLIQPTLQPPKPPTAHGNISSVGNLFSPTANRRAQPVPTNIALNTFDDINIKHTHTKLLQNFENNISNNLNKAASKGVLTFNTSIAPLKEGQTNIFKGHATSRELGPGINFLNSTPHHGDARAQQGAKGNKSANTCPKQSDLDVEKWGSEKHFYIQLSEKRRAVFDDVQIPTQEHIIDLAQTYLHFGFGREAINVLELLDTQTAQTKLYTAMGQMIDEDPVSPAFKISDTACDNSAALWALLAHTPEHIRAYRSQNADLKVNTNVAIRSFKDLPAALQKHLSFQLFTRFLSLNQPEIAEQVMTVTRGLPNMGLLHTRMQSALNLHDGHSIKARQSLETLAQTDTRFTPDELLLLLNLNLSEGTSNQDNLLQLADAMQSSIEGTQLANDLTIAVIKSHIKNNNFEVAFQKLSQDKLSLKPSDLASLQDMYLSHATKDLNDHDFINLTYEQLNFHQTSITENLMAKRLIALGFISKAAKILAKPVPKHDLEERIYLQAIIALKQGRKDEASRLLAPYKTSQADAIREASQLQSSGLFININNLLAPDLSSSQDLPSNDVLAWKSQNWEALQHSSDTLLSSIATEHLQHSQFDKASEAPLSENTQRLNTSAELRSTIQGIIKKFQ